MSNPVVGIVMGSDSDWPKINKVADAPNEFGVPFEVNVMSAHRTPHVVGEYATSAIDPLSGFICQAKSDPCFELGLRFFLKKLNIEFQVRVYKKTVASWRLANFQLHGSHHWSRYTGFASLQRVCVQMVELSGRF